MSPTSRLFFPFSNLKRILYLASACSHGEVLDTLFYSVFAHIVHTRLDEVYGFSNEACHSGVPHGLRRDRLLAGRGRREHCVHAVPGDSGGTAQVTARGVHQHIAAHEGRGTRPRAHHHVHLLQCGADRAAGLRSGTHLTLFPRQ